mmetsp:Transcript_31571/g.87049  ORF Transcript_31571/g.87049 Transcript_31571/m.87049 type:complete len:684 (-) Transcript_31571:281-2332(-)
MAHDESIGAVGAASGSSAPGTDASGSRTSVSFGTSARTFAGAVAGTSDAAIASEVLSAASSVAACSGSFERTPRGAPEASEAAATDSTLAEAPTGKGCAKVANAEPIDPVILAAAAPTKGASKPKVLKAESIAARALAAGAAAKGAAAPGGAAAAPRVILTVPEGLGNGPKELRGEMPDGQALRLRLLDGVQPGTTLTFLLDTECGVWRCASLEEPCSGASLLSAFFGSFGASRARLGALRSEVVASSATAASSPAAGARSSRRADAPTAERMAKKKAPPRQPVARSSCGEKLVYRRDLLVFHHPPQPIKLNWQQMRAPDEDKDADLPKAETAQDAAGARDAAAPESAEATSSAGAADGDDAGAKGGVGICAATDADVGVDADADSGDRGEGLCSDVEFIGAPPDAGDSAEEMEDDEEENEDEDDAPISDDESETLAGALCRADASSIAGATVADAALAALRGFRASGGRAGDDQPGAAVNCAAEAFAPFSGDAAYALFEETRLRELAPIGLAIAEAKGIVREDWNALGAVERARLRMRAARAAAAGTNTPAPGSETPVVAIKAPPPPPPRKWLLDADRQGPVSGLGVAGGLVAGRTGSSSSSMLPPPMLASAGAAPEAPSAVAAKAASMAAPVAAPMAAIPSTASGARRVLAADDNLVSSPSLRAKRSPVPNPKRRRYDDGL